MGLRRRLRDLEGRTRARASPRGRTPEERAEREAGFEALFADLDAEYQEIGLLPPARDEPARPTTGGEKLAHLFRDLDQERHRLKEGTTDD